MMDPTQAILLEHLAPRQNDQILILEGGDGSLAQAIANLHPAVGIYSLARDVRDIWAAEIRLRHVPNANSGYEVVPTTTGWDTVLLVIPKERRYARALLVAAFQALKPGGRLFLAGPTRKGAKSVIKDASSLFGDATMLGYRGHQRIAACTRGESPLTSLPVEFQQNGIAPGAAHIFAIDSANGSLEFETHPGIFSWENLDEGTALLLEHLEITPGECVWDVGCGYGVIGIWAALAGASSVFMTDVNLLSVDYAKRNALRNHLAESTCIFPADGLNPPPESFPKFQPPLARSFDLILSNPAFHLGHQVDRSMADDLISQAPGYLSAKGRLVLVANRFLNYDQAMSAQFSQVFKRVETNRYHLIEAAL